MGWSHFRQRMFLGLVEIPSLLDPTTPVLAIIWTVSDYL